MIDRKKFFEWLDTCPLGEDSLGIKEITKAEVSGEHLQTVYVTFHINEYDLKRIMT